MNAIIFCLQSLLKYFRSVGIVLESLLKKLAILDYKIPKITQQFVAIMLIEPKSDPIWLHKIIVEFSSAIPDTWTAPGLPSTFCHRIDQLPAMLTKLDKFDCVILDDLGYVRKDHAETNVLFELIAERYERKSLIVTCNQPFSEWGKIFPGPAVTVAAIDRLVHNSTIVEINTDSYRRRAAAENAATRSGRPEPKTSSKKAIDKAAI